MSAPTTNFKLPKEIAREWVRASMFNNFADAVDTALKQIQDEGPIPVKVPRMSSDLAGGGATPGGVNGRAWVVNGWAAGNYVGTYVGAFADGDIAEYSDALAGFVRVVTNVGGYPPVNTRVIADSAGLAGSFTGHAGDFAVWNGSWAFEDPTDGDSALVTGEQGMYENQTFIYDTNAWVSQGILSLPLSDQVYVDKLGNNTTGTGAIERPYLTVAAAIAAAVAGDTVIVGSGVYAETGLIINKQINLFALIPGTVAIQLSTAAGSILTVSGAAIAPIIDGINVVNLSAAGAAAIALTVNNTGATITGPVIFRNGTISSGAGASRALAFVGAAGGGLALYIQRAVIVGTYNLALAHAADFVVFYDIVATGGAAAWFNITGTAGRVIMNGFLLAAAAAAETLNFGGAAACGVVLSISNSGIAGSLTLDNLAGTGYVEMTPSAQFAQTFAAQNNQLVVKLLGNDEVCFTMHLIDANGAPGTIALYTVPALRTFNPHTVRTMNTGVATGAALNYQINGSGAGTVVAAVGAGVLNPGIANEIVLQDQVPAASVLEFQLVAASGQAGDTLDCEVFGRLL